MPTLRALPSDLGYALYGVARTRAIESRAAAALPAHALMARAGRATARLAQSLTPHAQRIWIAAGSGNNGGDGLAAAGHLARAGFDVQVSLLGDADRLPTDAAQALALARAAGVTVSDALPAEATLRRDDLAIDALLGIGGSRAPRAALAAAIARLNGWPGVVLAIDVPSGLEADTGRWLGDIAVRAHHTLALLTLKPGLFTAAGRDAAGEVWFDDLGVALDEVPDAWLAASPAPPARGHALHKGSFGDVAVIGGAPGMAGAALLAARAAHAAGAGRVFVQELGATALEVDPWRPELMFRPGLLADTQQAQRLACVVCGCGGGSTVREVLPQVLSLPARLVLDADALNAIADDAALQAILRGRAARGRATVLTPHPLEAARLLGLTTAQVQADRLATAQALAQR
ncbi:MAG: NAD(P)H-hydrate epimerase, partial [Burkholderiaceae bacterium]